MKRSIQGYGKMVGGSFASRDMIVAMVLGLVGDGWFWLDAIFLLDRSGAGGPSRKSMIIVAIIGFCGLLGHLCYHGWAAIAALR